MEDVNGIVGVAAADAGMIAAASPMISMEAKTEKKRMHLQTHAKSESQPVRFAFLTLQAFVTGVPS